MSCIRVFIFGAYSISELNHYRNLQLQIEDMGYQVINPMIRNDFDTDKDYTLELINCDYLFLLRNWNNSLKALELLSFASEHRKSVEYENRKGMEWLSYYAQKLYHLGEYSNCLPAGSTRPKRKPGFQTIKKILNRVFIEKIF